MKFRFADFGFTHPPRGRGGGVDGKWGEGAFSGKLCVWVCVSFYASSLAVRSGCVRTYEWKYEGDEGNGEEVGLHFEARWTWIKWHFEMD